jgi:hypothetical protein
LITEYKVRVLLGLGVLGCLLGLTSRASWAFSHYMSNPPLDSGSLRGVQGLAMVVLYTGPAAYGWPTVADLRDDLQRWLLNGGIRLLTDDELRRTPGMPLLSVSVHKDLNEYSDPPRLEVVVGLHQGVALDAGGARAFVPTWVYGQGNRIILKVLPSL